MSEMPLVKDVVSAFNVDRVRADFPILSREVYGKQLTYLDNAASAQKPRAVIDAVRNAYEAEYANVHRGLHFLSNLATERFEAARESVRRYLNAKEQEEIIFTSGSTDAINLVASSYLEPLIGEGDEIVLSVMEHHSNIVPWHYMRERHGAVLKWAPVTDEGDLDLNALDKLLGPKVKLLALTHMSNALGTITPMKRIVKMAHDRGIPVMVDGSQSAVHLPIDVQDLDCDFFALTGHKIYGPSGIGALYAKREHLEQMRPYRGGGEMIREVSMDRITYADPPHRFEAGTPPIVQAIGLGAALDYVDGLGRENILAHESALLAYATERMQEVEKLRLIGTSANKGSILSFVIEGTHPHDISMIIDRSGVAVRAGHHCAQPLMDRFDVPATSRASIAMYNTKEDIDRLVDALQHAVEFFG
jgi:cysteine desulfurase/selenocysteine lyase